MVSPKLTEIHSNVNCRLTFYVLFLSEDSSLPSWQFVIDKFVCALSNWLKKNCLNRQAMQVMIETSFNLSQLQKPNFFIYYLLLFFITIILFIVLGIRCLPDTEHNAFQWKLALKSLVHDRIWTYIFCLSVPSSITKKSYNVSVGWLQSLTMTDLMLVSFKSTKQSILVDALKGVWLCRHTICQKLFKVIDIGINFTDISSLDCLQNRK